MNVECDHAAGGKFCPECGKQLVLSPIDSRFLLDAFPGWMTKVFRNTVLGLASRPGHRVRDYLRRDRDLLVKPVPYLIVCAGLFIYVNDALPADACDKDALWLCGFLLKYSVSVQLALALTLGLVAKYVFYRSAGYGLFEILAMSVYLLAQLLLISALMLLSEDLGVSPGISRPLSIGIKFVYAALFVGQFFAAGGVIGWIKAAGAVGTSIGLFVVLTLGMMSAHDAVFALGAGPDAVVWPSQPRSMQTAPRL